MDWINSSDWYRWLNRECKVLSWAQGYNQILGHNWNDLNIKGLSGWYLIVSILLGVCYASGKPVRTASSHLTHHPLPFFLSPEDPPQLFKQQPGQGQCCEMVKTFVKRDSLPNISCGPHIPVCDGIFQGSSSSCAGDRLKQAENGNMSAMRRTETYRLCIFVCCTFTNFLFFFPILLCFMLTSIEGDLCQSKMWKMMEYIFLWGPHAMPQLDGTCQIRDKLHEARKVEI